ncbi:hypothetical protein BDW62DRAFT_141953 [Aspergillus aurantiobrunneus]
MHPQSSQPRLHLILTFLIGSRWLDRVLQPALTSLPSRNFRRPDPLPSTSRTTPFRTPRDEDSPLKLGFLNMSQAERAWSQERHCCLLKQYFDIEDDKTTHSCCLEDSNARLWKGGSVEKGLF